MRGNGEQPWLCNVYLNAISVSGADPTVFGPIRREFGRSTVWWRRPMQRAYVRLATSRPGAPWLAQAGLGISPPVAGAEQLLIVGGNHKLRLLDRAHGLAYGIVKSGFSGDYIRREIATRRQAEELALPVPPLVTISEDETWFSERYVSGTPLNRLADPRAAETALHRARRAVRRLLAETLEQVSLEGYLSSLSDQIERLISQSRLLPEPDKLAHVENARTIAGQIRSLSPAVGGRITTALTHGDFQPANILVDGEQVWLIDWEYAARRQAGYDALVFALQSRFPTGLARRLQGLLDEGEAGPPPSLSGWPGLDWSDPTARRAHSLLFLLEEWIVHLSENTNPRFLRLGDGLVGLQREIVRWLAGGGA
jgi:hypothetical protein